MKIIDNPCRDFIEELSSKTAVPGGGGAAALDGAMGAALLSMVCNFTIGKKRYKQYEKKLMYVLKNAGELKEDFLDMVDKDAENFIPLSKAYALPENTEAEKVRKEEILEKHLKEACIVPVYVIKKSYEAILLHESIVDICNTLVLSDVGVGVQCLKSAIAGAYLNVIINMRSLKDREYANNIEKEINDIIKNGVKIADEIYEKVVNKLSK